MLPFKYGSNLSLPWINSFLGVILGRFSHCSSALPFLTQWLHWNLKLLIHFLRNYLKFTSISGLFPAVSIVISHSNLQAFPVTPRHGELHQRNVSSASQPANQCWGQGHSVWWVEGIPEITDSLTEECYILGISSMTVQQGSCWESKHVHSCRMTLITTSSCAASIGCSWASEEENTKETKTK